MSLKIQELKAFNFKRLLVKLKSLLLDKPKELAEVQTESYPSAVNGSSAGYCPFLPSTTWGWFTQIEA